MTNSDCLDEPHPDLPACYHRAPGPEERAFLEQLGRPAADEQPVDGHNIRGQHEYIRGMSRRAAGGVQSTIPDMARYASALLRAWRGHRAPGDVRCDDRAAVVPGRPASRVRDSASCENSAIGRRTIGHGGGINGGWNTQMTVFPEQDLAVLQHLNITAPVSARSSRASSSPSSTRRRVERPSLPIDESLLQSAPGVFEAPLPGPLTNFRIMTSTGRAQLSARDGELWLHARRGPWKDGARMLPADSERSRVLHARDRRARPAARRARSRRRAAR